MFLGYLKFLPLLPSTIKRLPTVFIELTVQSSNKYSFFFTTINVIKVYYIHF